MTEIEVALKMAPHAVAAPTYATDGAVGADLAAALPEDAPLVLAPGARALAPTGISLALPPGFEAQLRPRSGLAMRCGVTILNAPATIDWDYRGEIRVLLINHGDEPVTIERGDRIAQLIVAPVGRAVWREQSELSETTRGAGGFGSTGGASALTDGAP